MRLPMLVLTALLAAPATAAAVPPANDHYLASTTITSRHYGDSVDTTDATTQPDMFDPNRDGLPFGGGDPEPTSCGAGSSYGRTAWWDFRPPSAGGVEIRADGGFDVVVAVYTWSQKTSRITRRVRCQNDMAGGERVVIPRVRAGRSYTIQVGGANDAGGALGLELDYFPDTDGDGIRDDAPDKCRTRPGLERFRGCPPELRSAARIGVAAAGSSLRIASVSIDDVPKGARAEVRCGGCGPGSTRRATRSGRLRMDGFVGRMLSPGDRIEVRITLGRTGKGRYRYGAVGRYYRWPVEAGRLGPKRTRCLQPGSRTPTRCR